MLEKLENRKGFKNLNVNFDKNNILQMSEVNKILEKYDVYGNEAKIKNLALLLSSGIYENMFSRFEELILLPAAPSKKRLELIYVDPLTATQKHNESMTYKGNKRRYTLKQFFSKSNFKKRGLNIENVTDEQIQELQKCFDLFFTEKEMQVSQTDLLILLDFVIAHNKELNYVERLLKLREMNGLHSTLEYKKIRYGEEVGKAKYDEFVVVQKNHNSLESFITKFGDEGEKKWNELNQLRSKTTKFNWSAEGFKKRFGITWKEEYEKWKTIVTQNMDNLPATRAASKSSLAVFLPVLEKIKQYDFDTQIGFGDSEEFIIDRWSYDLTIHELKLIFEFQGVAFHPNPTWSKEKLDGWRQVFSNFGADQVFAKDYFKKELAEDTGYEVIYIWEDTDVIENINFCLSEITARFENMSISI